jgi:cobalamin biosynthesis Mg chelatase CobN
MGYTRLQSLISKYGRYTKLREKIAGDIAEMKALREDVVTLIDDLGLQRDPEAVQKFIQAQKKFLEQKRAKVNGMKGALDKLVEDMQNDKYGDGEAQAETEGDVDEA